MDFIRNALIFGAFRKNRNDTRQNSEKQQEVPQIWRESYYLLSRYNLVRIPFIQNGIHDFGIKTETRIVDKAPLNGVKILDVGCGGGILCEELAKLGADVVGVDIDSEAIAAAKQHQALDSSMKNNPKYVCASIYHHERENFEKYDAVVVSEVIEHVPNAEKEEFLTSCINSLRPGGSLFMTSPSKTLFCKFIVVFLVELFGMVPRGTHDFEDFISTRDLIGMISNRRCKVRSVKGFFYNPLKKKFVVSSNKSLFYGIHALKIDEK